MENAEFDSLNRRLTYGPGTSYTVPSGSDLMSQAGSSAIGYTSTGNISSNGASTTFAYSKANRMASATVSATTSTYTYDAFGQRLKVKVGGGSAVPFSYDQAGHLLSEINSGTETDYAYIDDMPLSAIQPGAATISALHTDLIGTVQRATDSTKTINWTGNYQPFGAVSPTTTITMNLRYPGQYKDATGFNHNDFRDYMQSYGRHPEADLIGLAGGLNPYIYGLNNPLKYIDPWGLDVTISIATRSYSTTGNSVAGTISVTSDKTATTFYGFTMENARAGDDGSKSPIPAGTYDAFTRTDHSPNRVELLNVPGYQNIQIHNGSYPYNFKGCVGAGTVQSTDFLGGTVKSMSQINNIIRLDGTDNVKVIVGPVK